MKPRLPLFLAWLFCFVFTAKANADDWARAVPEYTMKAAYLYNFAQLTEWPAQPSAQEEAFNLCVYGQDELIAALEGLRGRTVSKRPLRVLRLTDMAELRQCHLLYVADGEGARGGRMFDALKGDPVLTVTDDPRAGRAGAMLTLTTDDRHLAFEVNLDAARRAQLKFSSKLLRLAKRVMGE
ncbi:MAG TPA: YfiR family protein [Rhodocyclaceae bacterium]|nr:YfiR family protein [Rhodocyclaceae bacterium]